MEALLAMFGFTTPVSTLWNLAAYGGFICIIVGVLYERMRNILIVFGSAVLAFYSALFLKDAVFAALQTLIAVSGVMQIFHCKRKTSTMTMVVLTVVALSLLIFGGALQSIATIVGVLGLLGIAFGIVFLPRRSAFVLMTIGGILLTAYAWTFGAWVFFWLNIFFALANIKEFRSARA